MIVEDTTSLIGTWRRFGIAGPAYEILRFERADPSGHTWMRVRVAETGEEVDYKLEDILDDPRER